MKIGFVSDMLLYLPSRGGFRLYGSNLIQQLSKRHTIDLVSLLSPGDEEHLNWAQQYCSSVETLSGGGGRWLTPISVTAGYLFGRPLRYRQTFAEILRRKAADWDVIHFEGSYLAALTPDWLQTPRLLSVHDAEVLRIEELLHCQMSRRERMYYRVRQVIEPRYDRLVYPRFQRTIVVADRDVEVVRRVAPKSRVELIPYGSDTEYFHAVPVAKEPNTLVFHSHLGYPPNIQAALEFANDVFPLIRQVRPEVTFHLVGADPDPVIRELANRPGIRLSANLPDLRPAVCAGSIYVSAIKYGTGLKSKILEAMGMTLPVVCYPGSTVGIDCVHGTHLLVAQNPQEFASYVIELLRNPQRAAAIATAGRQLVEHKYSWDARARVYEDLYARLVQESGPGQSTLCAATA